MAENGFVEVNGQRYYVNNSSLNLSSLGIENITDIWGLDKLGNLGTLALNGNQIKKEDFRKYGLGS